MIVEKRIEVADTRVTIEIGEAPQEYDARVSLVLTPFPSVEILVRDAETSEPSQFPTFQPVAVRFPGEKEPRSLSDLGTSPENGWRLGLPRGEPLLLGKPADVDTLVFELLNFGEPITGTFSDITLTSEAVEARLSALKHDRGIAQLLDVDQQRYIITHRGSYRHTAGMIPFAQVEPIRQGLSMFFTFSRGSFSGPAIIRGVRGDRVSWSMVEAQHTTPITFSTSWLDSQESRSLSKLFHGFWPVWNLRAWQEPLQRAIHWYARASSREGGVETSLVLAHAALEVLSWAKLVVGSGALSEDGFQRLNAADQIRLLLSSSKVPLDLPAHAEALVRLAKEYDYDGPELISQCRNSVLHPRHSKGAKLRRATVDAFELALWYLELALLSLCGYEGVYVNRLKSGYGRETESVPWAGES